MVGETVPAAPAAEVDRVVDHAHEAKALDLGLAAVRVEIRVTAIVASGD